MLLLRVVLRLLLLLRSHAVALDHPMLLLLLLLHELHPRLVALREEGDALRVSSAGGLLHVVLLLRDHSHHVLRLERRHLALCLWWHTRVLSRRRLQWLSLLRRLQLRWLLLLQELVELSRVDDRISTSRRRLDRRR